MKKIYAFLSASVLAAGINAQTVIHSNNFDNPSSFTLEAGSFNAWVINNVYQGGALFSGTMIPNVPSQPASFSNPNQNYLHPSSPLALSSTFQTITNANYVAGSGTSSLRAVMNTSVDATNYTNVTVSFWRVGGLNGMKVIYSINGGQTWQDAGLSFQGSPTAWTQESITVSALDGQSDVRIGFEMMEAQLADPAPNPYHSIDELRITGTPTPTGEINISLSVPITGYCSGQTVSANFTVTSGTINVGNQFALELSDATGSFTNPTVIGTLNGNQSSGTINGVLPNGLSGSNFRMRITSSNAAIIGNDNGSDFSIALSPATPIITLNSTTGQLQVTTNAPSFEWQFFGSTIPGSQNQNSITPNANGGYTVVATNGNCSTSSDIFTVNFVGIDEVNAQTVTVYPNPFENMLHFSFAPHQFTTISIADLSGKIVFETSAPTSSMNLETLNSGVYFVQFIGSTSQTVRVVKK